MTREDMQVAVCNRLEEILNTSDLNYIEVLGVLETVKTYAQGKLITRCQKPGLQIFKVSK